LKPTHISQQSRSLFVAGEVRRRGERKGNAHGVLYRMLLGVGLLFWARAGFGEGGALRAHGAEELKRRCHCTWTKLAGPLLGSIIDSAWRMEKDGTYPFS
jgi:hypothetical protein